MIKEVNFFSLKKFFDDIFVDIPTYGNIFYKFFATIICMLISIGIENHNYIDIHYL